jgi:hypothetical protein
VAAPVAADGAAFDEEPSVVSLPTGIHASPSAIARDALVASRKRNGFDLRPGDAQPRRSGAGPGFARDAFKAR